MSKSNSNKIKLCGGVGGNIILFRIRFQRYNLQFLSELNNIFHVKGLKRFTFHVKFDDRKKTKQEKY